jgi:CDP-glucose 4,6-dehydratase
MNHLGATVTGVSLPPETFPNLFTLADVVHLCHSHFCDIRDAASIAAVIKQVRPEIIFHLAAQPLVRMSYRKPLDTFETNVMGTAHVLEALRGLNSVRTAIIITTDKVYRNNEWPWPYREEDALGGHDPYSASKAACEIVVDCYRKAFLAVQGVAVASARAGNVIGGGDWSEDRLIPDAVRAWQSGQPLQIRRPEAIRPWQHALEPLAGYIQLAEQLWDAPQLAGAYNFGPETQEAATVRDVVSIAQQAYGTGTVIFDDGAEGPHEAGWLSLETAKARTLLGVKPRWSLEEAVVRTMNWYRAQNDGANARELCLADMAAFEALS